MALPLNGPPMEMFKLYGMGLLWLSGGMILPLGGGPYLTLGPIQLKLVGSATHTMDGRVLRCVQTVH